MTKMPEIDVRWEPWKNEYWENEFFNGTMRSTKMLDEEGKEVQIIQIDPGSYRISNTVNQHIKILKGVLIVSFPPYDDDIHFGEDAEIDLHEIEEIILKVEEKPVTYIARCL